MKKLILSTVLSGAVATCAFGQGQVNADNTANFNTSSTATSGGLVFTTSAQGVVSLENNPISIELFSGSGASLTPIVTLLASSGQIIDGAANLGQAGQFADTSGGTYIASGIPGGATGFLTLEAWEGNFASYEAAFVSGADVGMVSFANPTGGGTPPLAPQDLVGMPALILAPIPEPSTIILGGLGAAALLAFRRRK